MPKIRDLNYDGKGTKAWLFVCPACKENHAPIEGRWTFNGDYERPTFSPSILVRSTKMTEKGLADYEKWCEAGYPNRSGKPFESAPTVCHSFVTDGKIQYLSDCTHELAGQTVELNDWIEGE